MSLELWNTIGTVGTFVVIGASAIAAVFQLRHARTSNHLDAVLALERDFNSPDLQQSLCYVQFELAKKLKDRAFRAELESIGFVDPRMHLEMNVLNWFNQIGTLLKNGLIEENAFLDQFARLIDQYWQLLAPAISILRRRRGRAQYENFEYLASRSRHWQSTHLTRPFPNRTPRMPLEDPWLAEDGEAH